MTRVSRGVGGSPALCPLRAPGLDEATCPGRPSASSGHRQVQMLFSPRIGSEQTPRPPAVKYT